MFVTNHDVEQKGARTVGLGDQLLAYYSKPLSIKPSSRSTALAFWSANFPFNTYPSLWTNKDVGLNLRAMPQTPMIVLVCSAHCEASCSKSNVLLADPRFANIQHSSLYRLPSKKQTHVTLDPRFAHMLRDERFSSKAKVDRYGRRLQHHPKKGGSKELDRLYRVQASEQEEDDKDDEEAQPEVAQKKKTYDPARDGGFSGSSSSQEDSSDNESSSDDDPGDISYPVGQATSSDIPAGEVTKRIAVVNLDWDNIRAVDLMAVFSSFVEEVKGQGHIEKVVVYPSEFGKERMQREEREGPPKELFQEKEFSADSEGDLEDEEDFDEDERIRRSLVKEDKGEEFSSTRLRRYQLERLRYYYAVLSCSTPGIANHIYQNVDGAEYLSSANFFDLRFIPDETDFSDEQPRDQCDVVPDKYRPNEFVTDALQHSKVKLTWDADDTKRKEAQKRAFRGSRKEIDENDLQAYLGTDSSSDDASDAVEVVDATDPAMTVTEEPEPKAKLSRKEEERQRMRSLLGLSAEPAPDRPKRKTDQNPVGDMQITFTSGFVGGKSGPVFENDPLVGETTVEKYIRKEKERKAKRRDKAKAVRGGMEAEAEGEEEAAGAQDLGFDDPFFAAGPVEAKTASTKKSKEKERRKHKSKEEDGTTVTAGEATFENDVTSSPTNTQEMRHFSMPLLEKAEKALRKQQKSKGKKKLTTTEKAALEAKAKDDFKMDVSDPRFAAVFERSEYALDPTHPGFKGTEGMKQLLEEGRGRRKRGRGEEDEEDRRGTNTSSQRRTEKRQDIRYP